MPLIMTIVLYVNASVLALGGIAAVGWLAASPPGIRHKLCKYTAGQAAEFCGGMQFIWMAHSVAVAAAILCALVAAGFAMGPLFHWYRMRRGPRSLLAGRAE